MQLLNAANAKKTAEKDVERMQLELRDSQAEATRLGQKAEHAQQMLQEARREAETAREKAASASLSLERAQLQNDQDTLALQRQAASSAEEQMERIRQLHQELKDVREEQSQERAAHKSALSLAREEVKTHGQMRGEINMQLDRHKVQLEALTLHNEILAGLRREREAKAAAAAASIAEGGDEEGTSVVVGTGEEGVDGGVPAEPEPPASRDGTSQRETDSKGGSRAGSRAGISRAGDRAISLNHAPEAQPPAVVAELTRSERRVNEMLEMNRGLVEAYWRIRLLAEEASRLGQPLSLPSHEELSLQALVLPGAAGRRSVPSELEKALQKEKDTLAMQYEQCQMERNVAQRALQEASATQHRELASLVAELSSFRHQAAIHEERAERLQQRVLDLEEAVPAAKNDELVARLRKTQEELIYALRQLQAEGALDPLPASALEPMKQYSPPPPPRPPSKGLRSHGSHGSHGSRGGSGGSGGSERLVVDERTKRENEQLREQIGNLEAQLDLAGAGAGRTAAGVGGGGASADVRMLRLQVSELEGYQVKLERERSELARRAAAAEAQLASMQQYIELNLTKYQQEIQRLRQQIAEGGGKTNGGRPGLLPDIDVGGQRSRVSSRG